MGEVTFETELGSCFFGGLEEDAVYVGKRDGETGWISVCEDHKKQAEDEGYELMEPHDTAQVSEEDLPGGKDHANSSGDASSEDAKAEGGKPEDGKPEDGKPEDGKPEDGKPEDGKPEDGKPEDGKAGDTKSGDDGEPEGDADAADD